MPPEGGSFWQLASTRIEKTNNEMQGGRRKIKTTQRTNIDGERVKIRSYQRLVTPRETGSFRQLISTRRKKQTSTESRQNAEEDERQH